MRGRYPKRNREPVQEKPIAAAPEPPSHLSPAAVEIWKEVTSSASEYGQIVQLDFAILEQFAVTLALWRELAAEIRKHGAMVVKKTKAGKVTSIQANKAFVPFAKLSLQLATLVTQIGLSPAARARLRLVIVTAEKTATDTRIAQILGE